MARRRGFNAGRERAQIEHLASDPRAMLDANLLIGALKASEPAERAAAPAKLIVGRNEDAALIGQTWLDLIRAAHWAFTKR